MLCWKGAQLGQAEWLGIAADKLLQLLCAAEGLGLCFVAQNVPGSCPFPSSLGCFMPVSVPGSDPNLGKQSLVCVLASVGSFWWGEDN